jgi:thiosulfate/3-mercaptopyruvate sulfurtransferase
MKKFAVATSVLVAMSASLMALDLPANHIVDAKWLKEHAADKDLVIIDVRKNNEKHPNYNKGHIKGAVSCPLSNFREGRYYNTNLQKPIPGYFAAPKKYEETAKKCGITNDNAVVFYAGGNKAKLYRDGALAALVSMYYGKNNVAILDGGFEGYAKAGGETSTEATTKEGNYQIKKFDRGAYASLEDVDEAVTLKSAQFLDANGMGKPGKSHFKGDMTKPDPRRMAEGHLPGAKALHAKAFAVEKDGVFYLDTKENLTKKLKDAGIDTTKPIFRVAKSYF